MTVLLWVGYRFLDSHTGLQEILSITLVNRLLVPDIGYEFIGLNSAYLSTRSITGSWVLGKAVEDSGIDAIVNHRLGTGARAEKWGSNVK